KNSFIRRFSVLRFLRFQNSLDSAQTRRRAVDILKPMLDQEDFADLGIEQLRRWALWAHTDKILGLYGAKAAEQPIVRRSIVRYALSAPQPSARQFIDKVRRDDPELLADVEEVLKLEKSTGPQSK